MFDQIYQLLGYYASFTGGINVQLSLNSGSENPEHLKDLFKLVKKQIETKNFDENVANEFKEKFYNIVNEKETQAQPNQVEEVEDDDTLDDKYYIINYDEEPFIPQQHYFNSFYMVEQVMYDQDEAQQALQQEPGQNKEEEEEEEEEYHDQNEYHEGYDEEMDPREHGYDPNYEDGEGQYQ